jgi:Flp pilus assembly pilin Flp
MIRRSIMRNEWIVRRCITRAELAYLGLRSRAQSLSERLRRERGQTTMEYVMIIGLIALIIITVFLVLLWPTIKPAVQNLVNRIKNAITGGNIS